LVIEACGLWFDLYEYGLPALVESWPSVIVHEQMYELA
jgi:hypothetical protein